MADGKDLISKQIIEINEENFVSWLKNNACISEATCRTYPHVLDRINAEYNFDSYSYTSADVYEKDLNKIISDPNFNDLHNAVKASTRRFKEFLDYVAEENKKYI